MNPNEYERMFALEDKYWWFVARRRLALSFLGESEGPILDLGCGTGVVLRELQSYSQAVGVDMSERALEFCRRRGLESVVLGDGCALPFKDGSFGAIIGLDVFEHIEDDVEAFKEAYRVLKPGGIVILSVPAFMSLWGPHDVALMHFRRYRRREVEEKLQASGFQVTRASYSIFFLFPVVAVVRFFEKRRTGKAEANLVPVPKWLNKTLIALQGLEAWLIRRINLPWGSSVIAVAKKP